MNVISLPERFSDNFGEPISQLFRLMERLERSLPKGQQVLLDYHTARFTHPFYTLAIPLLIRQHEQRGFVLGVSEGFDHVPVAEYMECLAFPGGVCPEAINGGDYKSYFERFRAKTYLPIVNFPASQDTTTDRVRDDFLSCLNHIIAVQGNLNPTLRSAVMYLLDEAISNVIHHAHDDRGFLLAQFFPSKGYMDVCIGDTGRTLLGSYQNSDRHREISNDREAMAAALVGKSTKSGNVDRGFGISTSKRMLTQGLNGKYFLFSGNACNIHTVERNEIVDLPASVHWQGVYLAMRIPMVAPGSFNYLDYLE